MNDKLSFFQSIQVKVILFCFTLVTVILLLYLLYSNWQLSNEKSLDLETNSSNITHTLSENLVGPIWDYAKDNAERALLTAMYELLNYLHVM